MDNLALLGIINRFRHSRILVIGESMLDSYAEGTVSRICREAPVPIVAKTLERVAAGGAANTAVNVRALGGRVSFISVTGDDRAGARLRSCLTDSVIPTSTIIADRTRRTITKERVSADGQLLVRVDDGSTTPLSPTTEKRLIARIRKEYASCDAIILSDYGYGILSDAVIGTVRALAAVQPKPVIVDSKHPVRFAHLNPLAVKPNFQETAELLGINPDSMPADQRADFVSENAETILDRTQAALAAVTLDASGSLMVQRGHVPYHIPTKPNPDSRAAGAGDTFVAALALSLISGASARDAGILASHAAAVVVAKNGTSVCTNAELRSSILALSKYVHAVKDLVHVRETYRQQGKRVVFTNGCFDILHHGHVSYLERARSLGDILIVALNSDASVRQLKGANRPINPLTDRIQVISGLGSVDHVASFGSTTPIPLIEKLKPDIFVKGGDYTRDTLPEVPVVERLGGSIKLIPLVSDRSTTRIISKIMGASVPATAGAPGGKAA